MIFKRITLLLSLMLVCISGTAAIVQINGHWSDEKYAPRYSIPEHFDLGNTALEKEDWREALNNFLVITLHFPESPFYANALFYSGICYYHLNDYDLANRQLNAYLNLSGTLKHFEEVFEYKYLVAEAYAKGGKKHLWGLKKMPKLLPAKGDAIELYDEVIASLPGREIAAKAYSGKAKLQRKRREYRESIETLQALIKRFPKHRLSAEGYLTISEIYLEESKAESQNPDLLALAELNMSRFQRSFPGEESLQHGWTHVQEMKNVFAESLYKTGRFYEKKKKPAASAIYYRESIRLYPDSSFALKCQERLQRIQPTIQTSQEA